MYSKQKNVSELQNFVKHGKSFFFLASHGSVCHLPSKVGRQPHTVISLSWDKIAFSCPPLDLHASYVRGCMLNGYKITPLTWQGMQTCILNLPSNERTASRHPHAATLHLRLVSSSRPTVCSHSFTYHVLWSFTARVCSCYSVFRLTAVLHIIWRTNPFFGAVTFLSSFLRLKKTASAAAGFAGKKKRLARNFLKPLHGAGVRDYVHVVDLAKGHVATLNKVMAGGLSGCKVSSLAC